MIKIKNFCKGVQGKKLYIATEWRRSRFCYAEFTRLAAAVNELASFTDGDSRDTEMDSRAHAFLLKNYNS